MSVQNNEKQYSYDVIPELGNTIIESDPIIESEPIIQSGPIIGGPPVFDFTPLQATGCTEADLTLYNQVNHSTECAIISEGSNISSLGKSVVLSDEASKPPLSFMIELVTGPYVDCGTEIPSDKRQMAYKAFTEATGFDPINYNQVFNQLTSQQKKILNFNAFYIFFPLFLLSLIVIWLMAGFGWFDWIAGLFLSGLVFIILYGFSMLYRIHAQSFLNDQNNMLQNDANVARQNFEDSVAYFPQGLFAAACAITSTGGTGWVCNNLGDCPTCPARQNSRLKSSCSQKGGVCMGANTENISIDELKENSSLIRKRRNIRQKKK